MLMKVRFSFVVSVVATVFLTIIIADVFYKRYNGSDYQDVFSTTNNLYFLQHGVYSNLETLEKSCKNLEQYTVVEEDNKYYVYVGVTASDVIASRIKGYFKKENIEIYLKEVYVDNEAFINEVEQYDILLDNSDTLKEVNSVMKSVLATYEEIVLKK